MLGDMCHDELPSGGEKWGEIMFMALYKNQISWKKKKKKKRKRKEKERSQATKTFPAESVLWCDGANFLALYLSCLQVKQISFSGQWSGMT